jgi:hypothetical protein
VNVQGLRTVLQRDAAVQRRLAPYWDDPAEHPEDLRYHAGPGWAGLVDRLLTDLQAEHDGQFRLSQVKEKFGLLVVDLHWPAHVPGPTRRQMFGPLRHARAASGRVCDVCGRPGTLLGPGTPGWTFGQMARTRCATHLPDDDPGALRHIPAVAGDLPDFTRRTSRMQALMGAPDQDHGPGLPPAQAAQWSRHGFTPAQAARWSEADLGTTCPVEVAAAWRDAAPTASGSWREPALDCRYTPATVALAHQHGWSVPQVAALAGWHLDLAALRAQVEGDLAVWIGTGLPPARAVAYQQAQIGPAEAVRLERSPKPPSAHALAVLAALRAAEKAE